ncbi:MAG: class I SAM-dependent methyltransferase [Anaerolineae bacterium]
MRHHEQADSMAMRPREYRVMYEIEEDYWWYRGLRALLAELLARYLPQGERGPILDAGCGTGANLKLLLDHADAIGVDIAQEAVEFCRLRGIPPDRTLLASILELPFPDQFFQLAFSFDVICNIEDDVSAFAEIGRVLRPGGRMIVQLPAYRFLWSAHDVAVGHKHRYTAENLSRKIERAGLVVERITYLNTLLFPFEMLARFWRRPESANGGAHSDLTPLPGPVNTALTRLFETEMRLAPHVRFPYGLSLLAVARKAAPPK